QEERQQIENKAKANGTFGKAPNGKKSNLSKEQWITVRTKRFKKWFGDWELMQKDVDVILANSRRTPKNIAEARTYARENLQGKSFVNKDTGETITIGR